MAACLEAAVSPGEPSWWVSKDPPLPIPLGSPPVLDVQLSEAVRDRQAGPRECALGADGYRRMPAQPGKRRSTGVMRCLLDVSPLAGDRLAKLEQAATLFGVVSLSASLRVLGAGLSPSPTA